VTVLPRTCREAGSRSSQLNQPERRRRTTTSASHITAPAREEEGTKDAEKKQRLTILSGVGLIDLDDRPSPAS
jgi:hypothetical protein